MEERTKEETTINSDCELDFHNSSFQGLCEKSRDGHNDSHCVVNDMGNNQFYTYFVSANEDEAREALQEIDRDHNGDVASATRFDSTVHCCFVPPETWDEEKSEGDWDELPVGCHFCRSEDVNTTLLRVTEEDMTDWERDNLEEMNMAVKKLLDEGASVNAIGWEGATPLMNACKAKTLSGGETLVNLLINAGADVNSEDDSGTTALMLAAENNTEIVVASLLEKGADVNKKDAGGGSALIRAASDGNPKVVKLLLNTGADFDALNCYGFTPLIATFACADNSKVSRESRTKIAALLLAAGANVNKTDHTGRTALMHACENGMQDHYGEDIESFLTVLLKAGADVNAAACDGSTALINMCKANTLKDDDMVDLLLDHGADVNAQDNNGTTPLLTAAFSTTQNAVYVAAVLLSRGAEVNHKNIHGNSVAEAIDLSQQAADRLSTVLVRGGADFGQIDLDRHERIKEAVQHCKENKLCLKNLCREKIRLCLMTERKGRPIAELAAELVNQVNLPVILTGYIADKDRFVLPF